MNYKISPTSVTKDRLPEKFFVRPAGGTIIQIVNNWAKQFIAHTRWGWLYVQAVIYSSWYWVHHIKAAQPSDVLYMWKMRITCLEQEPSFAPKKATIGQNSLLHIPDEGGCMRKRSYSWYWVHHIKAAQPSDVLHKWRGTNDDCSVIPKMNLSDFQC